MNKSIKKFIPEYFLSILRKLKFLLEDYFRVMKRLPRGSILSSDKFLQNEMISKYNYKNLSTYGNYHSLETNKNLAFDVGAFTGNSVNRIRSLGYSEIVCFEPDPDSFSILVKKYSQEPGITLLNFAVSDLSKSILSLTSNKDLPWLNTLNQDWISGTRHEKLFLRTQTHQVETITLDDAINLYGELPAYIKIDVEGHELSVLAGLSLKPDLLSFEWISELLDKNEKALQYIHRLGFNRFNICIEEALPDSKLGWLNLSDCIIELNNLKANDINNDNWGNIFCK